MPSFTGDRFSSANMSDCEFCRPEGRRFRTTRQCAECRRYLCLVCRPQIPGAPFLCPHCGGGPCEDALHQPGSVIRRLAESGHTVPFWLTVIEERLARIPTHDPDELIVPE